MNKKITENLFNALYGADAEDNPFETKELQALYVSLPEDENRETIGALLFQAEKNAFIAGYRTAFQLIFEGISSV